MRWAKTNRIQPRSLADDEPIGAWNRIKRYFITRWTAQIELGAGDAELGLLGEQPDGFIAGALEEAVASVEVVSAVPIFGNVDEGGDPVPEPEPVFEGRISGVMVEERRDTGELFMEERTKEDLTLKVPDIERGRRE